MCFYSQGLIDIDKEVQKLREKTLRIEKENTRLADAAAQPDYINKVPEQVRAEKSAKMASNEEEISRLQRALEDLLRLGGDMSGQGDAPTPSP